MGLVGIIFSSSMKVDGGQRYKRRRKLIPCRKSNFFESLFNLVTCTFNEI